MVVDSKITCSRTQGRSAAGYHLNADRSVFIQREKRHTENQRALWNGAEERVTALEGDGVLRTQEQRDRMSVATSLYPMFQVVNDARSVLPEVHRVNAYSP